MHNNGEQFTLIWCSILELRALDKNEKYQKNMCTKKKPISTVKYVFILDGGILCLNHVLLFWLM